MNILDGLDDDQKTACLAIDKPVLSLAGPGSGKTRLLTHSIAYRLEQGVDPDSIAALTFTHKGASEIKERVIKLCGNEAKQCDISTYHSFVNRNILMINKHHPAIKDMGYRKSFVICSEDDERSSLKIALSNLPTLQRLLVEAFELKPREIKSFMSFERANGLLASEYLSTLKVIEKESVLGFKHLNEAAKLVVENYDDEVAKTEFFELAKQNRAAKNVVLGLVWRQYEEVLVQSNAMDFDGMLVATLKMLERDEKLCKELGKEFRHILLDEFQDTNTVQYKIFSLIAKSQANNNLFAVGDIRQILYRFRNTDASVSEKFAKDFGAGVFTLDKNYRSTPEIISLGNAIGFEIKTPLSTSIMQSVKTNGNKPVLHSFDDDLEEANYISNKIQGLLDSGVNASDIAIMYRTKSIKKEVEAKLVELQIPHTIVGDRDFYETKEVMDIMALLRTVVHDGDYSSGARVIDSLNCGVRGITARYDVMESSKLNNKEDMISYLEKRVQSGKRLPKQVDKLSRLQNGSRALRRLKTQASKMTERAERIEMAWRSIKDDPALNHMEWSEDELLAAYELLSEKNFFDNDASKDAKHSAAESAKAFTKEINKFYSEYMRPVLEAEAVNRNDETALEVMQSRDRNVETLLEALVSNCITKQLLLAEALDELVMRAESEEKYSEDKVQMLTVHASKGLEFKHAFLIGAEQETFFKDRDFSLEDLNSEQCALFVAVTRAEEYLEISMSKSRFINGQTVSRSPLELLFNNPEALDALEFPNAAKAESNKPNTLKNLFQNAMQ